MVSYTGNPDSAKNQRIMAKLVDREVYYCVSHLISHFFSNPEACGEDYQDDLMNLGRCVDWEQTWEEASDYTLIQDSEGQWYIVDSSLWENDKDDLANDIAKDVWLNKYSEHTVEDPTDFHEICGYIECDPVEMEVLEHWIVSNWLYDQLSERGQSIGIIHEIDVWGRTTTGQSISQDGIIFEIARDMEILEGQKNEWSV